MNKFSIFLSKVKEYKTNDSFPGYLFGNNGLVFNERTGRTLNPKYRDSRCLIDLTDKNGNHNKYSLHRVLFETYYRKLDKSEVVLFIDNDGRNMDYKNLYACKKEKCYKDGYKKAIENKPRNTNYKLNKNKQYNTNEIPVETIELLGLRFKQGIIYYCHLDNGWFYKN